jgi:hypothetical protein
MAATLEYHKDLREHGIPGLLSPKGFSIAYDEYMEHLTDELNAVTSGMGPSTALRILKQQSPTEQLEKRR